MLERSAAIGPDVDSAVNEPMVWRCIELKDECEVYRQLPQVFSNFAIRLNASRPMGYVPSKRVLVGRLDATEPAAWWYSQKIGWVFFKLVLFLRCPEFKTKIEHVVVVFRFKASGASIVGNDSHRV